MGRWVLERVESLMRTGSVGGFSLPPIVSHDFGLGVESFDRADSLWDCFVANAEDAWVLCEISLVYCLRFVVLGETSDLQDSIAY